jgi:hypothetical protein
MNEIFDLWMYNKGYQIILTAVLIDKIITEEGGSHQDESQHEYEPAMGVNGLIAKCTDVAVMRKGSLLAAQSVARTESEKLMAENKKDTSPMVKARRIKRQVRIQEINNPPSSLFDITVEYPSDGLPEWFKGLQSIVEDEVFTGMIIYIAGRKVDYHITIVGPLQRCDCCNREVARRYDVTPATLGGTTTLHVCKDCYDLETRALKQDGYDLDLGMEG